VSQLNGIFRRFSYECYYVISRSVYDF
jgi:hypothetical protein